MTPRSASLRQWCPECAAATPSKPCLDCGGQVVTCAVCDTHPDCVGSDDGEAEYDYDNDDDE